MAETLANFLIEIGVDAGSAMKKVDQIEKSLKGLDKVNLKEQTLQRSVSETRRRIQAVNLVEQMRQREIQKTVNKEIAASQVLKRKSDLDIRLSKITNTALQDKVKMIRHSINAWNGERSALNDITREVSQLTNKQRMLNKQMSAGNYVSRGLRDSLNNLARSYISVFALIQGGGAVLRTSAQFQSLENSLVAVDGTTQKASKTFNEIKTEARELGTALQPAIEGYTKLSIAGAGTFSTDEIKEINTALMEGSVAFGLSAEESAGAVKALEQMMAKGRVTAEELRGQLAERMPVAIEAMTNAAGVSKEEFAEMLEEGKVSIDVLKNFGKELRLIARRGGLLEKQQNSLRASQNRLTLSIQEAINTFSKAGFAEGMKDFFDGMAAGIKASMPLWKALGVIAGWTLKVLGTLAQVFGEAVGLIGKGAEKLTDVFGELTSPMLMIFSVLGSIFGSKMLGRLGKFNKLLGKSGFLARKFGTLLRFAFSPLNKILLIGTLIIGVFDEIFNFFRTGSDKKIGLFSAPEGYESGVKEFSDFLAKSIAMALEKVGLGWLVGNNQEFQTAKQNLSSVMQQTPQYFSPSIGGFAPTPQAQNIFTKTQIDVTVRDENGKRLQTSVRQN